MSHLSLLLLISSLSFNGLISAAYAAEEPSSSVTETNAVWLHGEDKHPYNQLFSLLAGTFHPATLALSNSTYRYEYTGGSLDSYDIEPGWSFKLFHLLGAVYLQENLAFSTFKGSLPDSASNLSLFMIATDTRIKYSCEWFPIHAVIPFLEGGYRYTFLSQSGPSDFESAQDTVGNFVAGAGVDLWLNAMFGSSHDSVNRYDAVPILLTAKLNRILSNHSSDINLETTNFLAGLSIGI
jgi:hypothetical protein